jgi:hypothetical protein
LLQPLAIAILTTMSVAGATLTFAGTVSATTPGNVTPVASNVIGLLPGSSSYGIVAGASDQPAASWVLGLNGYGASPAAWTVGDSIYIAVMPSSSLASGGVNDYTNDNYVVFANTPSVVASQPTPTPGAASPCLSSGCFVKTETNPNDTAADFAANLQDVLVITLNNAPVNESPSPSGLWDIVITNVSYTTGANTSFGPISTGNGTTDTSTYVLGSSSATGAAVLNGMIPDNGVEALVDAAPVVPVVPVSPVGSTPLPNQIYGTDAIGTSIAISQAEFPTAGSAQAVVLARSDFFSDALAGGPLAAAIDGPLLLTEGTPESASLDPRTQAEIQRVLPTGGTVYILGGDLALSPNIDTTLQGLGYTVVREAGADEYATAVDIAEQLGNPTTIFEATGLTFYDALSAVPAAIEEHAAILLTDGSTQAPETATYLAAHPGDTRYAIGGPLAAYGADPTATPIYGQDLFSTSAAVAAQFFPNATIFGAATASEFSDALGGGVYMATGGRMGPLLLVNPTAPLPTEILPYLASLAVGTQGYVFGGPLAVGADVLAALQAAVG